MMDNDQLADLFEEAIDQGIVTDIVDAECDDRCTECPAAPACEQLAEDRNYKTFLANYRRDIYPIMKDRQDEDR